MRPPFLLALAALTALACTAHPAPAGAVPERAEIRVVSYNIHAGKDASRQPNLERVARVIDSLRADIVLLQEVDRGTDRSGHVDQVAELERLTGMHGAFAKSLDFQGGDYGIAALSRWPIQSSETVPLPTDPHADRGVAMYEPRVAIHLVVTTPAGPLHVAGTHLGAESESTFRNQEAAVLLDHLRTHVPSAAPLIIGGDFNSTPDSEVYARFSSVFTDSWKECGSGDGFTFPADSAARRIDYVYARGLRCTVADVANTQASDHRPLVVTFGSSRAAGDGER
jgi:endonuclease/exonuclease/phosphatase family metal-dependent hydrolase